MEEVLADEARDEAQYDLFDNQEVDRGRQHYHSDDKLVLWTSLPAKAEVCEWLVLRNGWEYLPLGDLVWRGLATTAEGFDVAMAPPEAGALVLRLLTASPLREDSQCVCDGTSPVELAAQQLAPIMFHYTGEHTNHARVTLASLNSHTLNPGVNTAPFEILIEYFPFLGRQFNLFQTDPLVARYVNLEMLLYTKRSTGEEYTKKGAHGDLTFFSPRCCEGSLRQDGGISLCAMEVVRVLVTLTAPGCDVPLLFAASDCKPRIIVHRGNGVLVALHTINAESATFWGDDLAVLHAVAPPKCAAITLVYRIRYSKEHNHADMMGKLFPANEWAVPR